jgi:Bacterial PH domain
VTATPPLPALPVTFRPTRTRVVLLTVGVAVAAVLTALGLYLGHLRPGEEVGFVFTGLLFLAVLVLLSRPKVIADADGLTIVNLTTQRRLSWPEVLKVNLRVGDPWVHLDLADGTSLPVLGIQPGIAKAQAVHDARLLRAIAEEYGAAPTRTSDAGHSAAAPAEADRTPSAEHPREPASAQEHGGAPGGRNSGPAASAGERPGTHGDAAPADEVPGAAPDAAPGRGADPARTDPRG